MPLIPVPGGSYAVRLAFVVVVLVVVAFLFPLLVVGWLHPTTRKFILELVRELRNWTAVILGDDQARMDPPDHDTPEVHGDQR
jgi:hypothetical protein